MLFPAVLPCAAAFRAVILVESQRFCPLALFPGIEVGRTFRHDDDVGIANPLRKVTQLTDRHQMVMEHRSVVIHQYYGC